MLNSDKLYRQIIEAVREGIWVIDNDARITFVNQSIADLLGYTTDEIRGRSVFDFVFVEDQQLLRQRLALRKAVAELTGRSGKSKGA